jgi:putative SOS response-associated peptidase YedK
VDGNEGRQTIYAIAMKDRSLFGIAGIWENWKNPEGEWVRTFALLTTPANELVSSIHDRMPAILKPQDYERWPGPDAGPGPPAGAVPVPAHGHVADLATGQFAEE